MEDIVEVIFSLLTVKNDVVLVAPILDIEREAYVVKKRIKWKDFIFPLVDIL